MTGETVYRLEFEQPDGRWTGPYCAEHMTENAFAVRATMTPLHLETRPFPDAGIFAANPGRDRYVCGAPTMERLQAWFGEFLPRFLREGGYTAIYVVPATAVAWRDEQQIVYQQRQAVFLHRTGTPPPAPLVYRPHPG